MKKKSLALLLLITMVHTFSFAQETESVLSAPGNWKGEIIPFPINFAPDIDLVGIEDLKFAPSWRDSSSQEFWTYTFVWYVDIGPAMSESKLTEYFNYYYDGLMGIDYKNKADSTGLKQLDKTLCLFVKTEEGFTGKMRVYDNFFTKDYMTLNVKVKESFCNSSNKQVIFCDISPQSFDHKVWDLFDEVKLKEDCDQ